MPSNRFRVTTRLRRFVVAGLAFALAFGHVGTAAAGVDDNNQLRSEVRLNPPLVGFYDYQLGSAASWATGSDFDSAGTHTGTTAQDVADTLTLERIGPSNVTEPDPTKPWWNEDWETRTCFDITHPGSGSAVTEYPLRISYNLGNLRSAGLLQANDADLRLVSQGNNLLPMWEESSSVMWVQMDEILPGTSTYFCLYYNAPDAKTPSGNHTEEAVFTYTQFKDVYFAVSNRFSSAGSAVEVVSYTSSNEVRRDGGTTVSLSSPGSRATFGAGGTNRNSVFAVKGPIASLGSGDGFDTLVPISFAGTDFVVPTNRGTNRFSIYAPFGTAGVTISNGSAPPYASFTVSANTSVTHGGGDINGNNAAIIRSTQPVLVTHYAGSQDAIAVYPATNASLYGVRSARTRVSSLGSGTITIEDSGGSINSYSVTSGETVVENGTDQGGASTDAVRVNGSGRIGALQQRDGDGVESTVYLPASELNREYWIPGSHQYIATACPSSATITLTTPSGSNRSFNCNGSPGHGLDSTTTSVTGGTGSRISSNAGVFYAYFEFSPRNDEHVVLGMKQGRQYTWPAPSVGGAGTPEGLLEGSGVWLSDDIDGGVAESHIFGEIDFDAVEPAGSSLEIRVATSATPGPTNFVGPDGLATSFWTMSDLPSILDFDHDLDRYLKVEIRMTTTDRFATTPEVDSMTVDYNLPLVARDAGTAASLSVVNPSSSFMTTYLMRVRTDAGAAGTAQLFVDGGSWANLVTGVLRMENTAAGLDSAQWTESSSSPTPVVFNDLSPHSIVLDHDKTTGAPADLNLRWQLNVAGPGSIFIETDVDTRISDS